MLFRVERGCCCCPLAIVKLWLIETLNGESHNLPQGGENEHRKKRILDVNVNSPTLFPSRWCSKNFAIGCDAFYAIDAILNKSMQWACSVSVSKSEFSTSSAYLVLRFLYELECNTYNSMYLTNVHLMLRIALVWYVLAVKETTVCLIFFARVNTVNVGVTTTA